MRDHQLILSRAAVSLRTSRHRRGCKSRQRHSSQMRSLTSRGGCCLLYWTPSKQTFRRVWERDSLLWVQREYLCSFEFRMRSCRNHMYSTWDQGPEHFLLERKSEVLHNIRSRLCCKWDEPTVVIHSLLKPFLPFFEHVGINVNDINCRLSVTVIFSCMV